MFSRMLKAVQINSIKENSNKFRDILLRRQTLKSHAISKQFTFGRFCNNDGRQSLDTRILRLSDVSKLFGLPLLKVKRFLVILKHSQNTHSRIQTIALSATGLFCLLGLCGFEPAKKILGSVDAFFGGYGKVGQNFIADIVDKVGKAVVFVEIKGKHPTSGRRVTLANGSGFIVRSNGLILTNSHVVEKATRVAIKLHDGVMFEGRVMVVDPVCDLAIIKIDAGERELSVMPLGESCTIRPGEFVAAMGSPLSLHRTTTVGIVSSPLRASTELGLPKSKIEYIQTDAVIGLGNSGGPLVNMDSKAIGINTLKLTDGICFAIPTDYATKLLDKAEAMLSGKADDKKKPSYMPNGQERSRSRYMGITMLPLTPAITMELRDKNKDFPHIMDGVYVYKVIVSSPAYAGGLHAGDVITKINGTTMKSSADVYKMVDQSDKLEIQIIRGKHQECFTVDTEPLWLVE